MHAQTITTHPKLDPELIETDLWLQLWAPWAKPRWGSGWPGRSAFTAANEGGREAAQAEWPREAVLVDQQVAVFPPRHAAAIMSQYFHGTAIFEVKAQLYSTLCRQLARAREQRVVITMMRQREKVQRKRGVAMMREWGEQGFKRDLDRARWMMKAALRLP